ncbi:MAG: efflux RND transporter periplasmic adaptor subunit [Nannocystis sp.]|nr:efflux RND transporter periplasmic adaptor subunit [Nannocystis sp.]MBA3550039.1 efflux RND transporter periplasmic adaptor subunit [Nannocystis sp.]
MRRRIGLLGLLSLLACEPSSAHTGAALPAPETAALRVRGVAARREAIERGSLLIGRLEPHERAPLGARMSGILTELRVDVGDRVRAGQILGSVRVPGLRDQIASATAMTAAARYELELREDTAARVATAAERNPSAVAAHDLSSASGSQKSALARAKAAEAEAERLRHLAADARIVAPFDGAVIARRRDPGASVNAGDVVVEVARVDKLRLRVNVPEAQIGDVRPDQAVILVLPAYGGRQLEARISRIAPAIDPATRMLPIEIDVLNPKGELLAGIIAEVQLVRDPQPPALVVPAEAVLREGLDRVVYVASERTVRRRLVRTGHDSGILTEIIEGVAEGDIVLVGGRGLLRDGIGVEVAP